MYAIGLNSIVLWVNLHLRHRVIELHVLLPDVPAILDGFDSTPELVGCDVS